MSVYREKPDVFPVHVTLFDLKPGEPGGVQVTYQCESLDAAMRTIHQAAALYVNVDAEYRRETGELVLTMGCARPTP